MPPTYDRTANEGLLKALGKGGWAHSLIAFANTSGYALDLQLRGYANKSNEKWATVYVGLQKVLDLRHIEGKGFCLRAHISLAKPGNRWNPKWTKWQNAETLSSEWTDVELYLERVIPTIAKSSIIEGAVQAAVCGLHNDALLVIDREAALTYKDNAEKSRFTGILQRPLLNAMNELETQRLRAAAPQQLGGECDALAVSIEGHLLAIEIKPRAATSTIRWAPLQVRHYANLFAGWVDEVGDAEAARVINKMVTQRARLGLVGELQPKLKTPIVVQPMVAIARGYSEATIADLQAVQRRLVESGQNTPPLSVNKVALWGELIPIDL